MMRPKSATFYLDKIQDIADDFVRYIQRNRDPGSCRVSKSKILTPVVKLIKYNYHQFVLKLFNNGLSLHMLNNLLVSGLMDFCYQLCIKGRQSNK